MTAINAINTIDANDSTVNVVGGNQININHFHVDNSCNTGKLMKQSSFQAHRHFYDFR